MKPLVTARDRSQDCWHFRRAPFRGAVRMARALVAFAGSCGAAARTDLLQFVRPPPITPLVCGRLIFNIAGFLSGASQKSIDDLTCSLSHVTSWYTRAAA